MLSAIFSKASISGGFCGAYHGLRVSRHDDVKFTWPPVHSTSKQVSHVVTWLHVCLFWLKRHWGRRRKDLKHRQKKIRVSVHMDLYIIANIALDYISKVDGHIYTNMHMNNESLYRHVYN